MGEVHSPFRRGLPARPDPGGDGAVVDDAVGEEGVGARELADAEIALPGLWGVVAQEPSQRSAGPRMFSRVAVQRPVSPS